MLGGELRGSCAATPAEIAENIHQGAREVHAGGHEGTTRISTSRRPGVMDGAVPWPKSLGECRGGSRAGDVRLWTSPARQLAAWQGLACREAPARGGDPGERLCLGYQ